MELLEEVGQCRNTNSMNIIYLIDTSSSIKTARHSNIFQTICQRLPNILRPIEQSREAPKREEDVVLKRYALPVRLEPQPQLI